MKRVLACLAVLLLPCGAAAGGEAAFLGTPSVLKVPKSSAIGMKGAAPEPPGAYRLCYEQPAHCRAKEARGPSTDQGRIRLDAALWALIQQVNSEVNASIRPVRDGATDLWTVGARSGDCEDYALAKRARLLKSGFPTSAVLMATAHTRSGERHAVLIVRTDRGDYVLDNRSAGVKPWTASGLRLEYVQSPQDPRRWHRVS